MRRKCSKIVMVSVIGISASLATQGYAQTVQGSAAEDVSPRSGISDIVVTAEKRQGTAQTTAIALNVLEGAALKANNVGSLVDIAALAPGVNYTMNNAATIFAIRGVSSRDSSEIGDPAVSISVDGFNLQRSSGLNASVFDLERIEVLRGPQGTLLGRNATGGAINIITAKPKDHFEGYISGTLGNYGTYNTEGAMSIPVNDWLKLRAAFQTRDHDGYRNNAPARNGDDEHSKAARLHVQLDPTERLSILLSGDYSHTGGVGPVVQSIPWNFTSTGAISYQMPTIPGNGKTFAVPAGGYIDITNYNLRWNAAYKFGFATLTYLGGWRELDYSRLGTLGGAYGTVRQDLSFTQVEHPVSWNHEVRLASSGKSKFVWQVGLFAFQEKNNLLTNLLDYPGVSNLYGTPVPLTTYVYPDILAKSKAVFGQASYALTDTLKIEGGARYSTDDKHRIGYNIGTSIANYYNAGTYNRVTANQNSFTSSSKTTFHAALNWQWSPRNLAYAKFDTGYKAGGFTDTNQYGPESVTAYEIGAKNRFFDNKLQLNLAAYLYNYKDQQVSQNIISASGGIGSVVLNAGSTQYYGFEADIIAQLTPDDRFNVSPAYSHAEYQTFAVSLNGANKSLTGYRPPQAPRVSLNAGYEHTFHVLGGTLTPRIQTHYESSSYFTFFNYNTDRQPGYTKSDAMLTYTSGNKVWSVEAYIRNIEDRLILANAVDPTSANYQTYRYQYQAPRTFGARATFNF